MDLISVSRSVPSVNSEGAIAAGRRVIDRRGLMRLCGLAVGCSGLRSRELLAQVLRHEALGVTEKGAAAYDPLKNGYIGDGASHPLSSIQPDRSLASWQLEYPTARSLSDEMDGLALQKTYDACAALGIPAYIDIGRSTGRLTRPLVTGSVPLIIRGAGEVVSKLICKAGLVVHGSTAAPATGPLALIGVALRDASDRGSGTIGVDARFAHTIAQPNLFVDNVGFHKWTRPLRIANAPRGVVLNNVNLFSPNYIMQEYPAIEIVTDAAWAGLTYTFTNVLTVGYRWGWQYNLLSHLEGQIFVNCRSYSGWGMVQVNNNSQSYRSLLWRFTGCDWQGLGFALDMNNCRQIKIDGGFWIFNNNTDKLPTPTGSKRRMMFRFNNCLDFTLTDVQISWGKLNDNPTAIYCDGKCRNGSFIRTVFFTLTPAYAGFEWAANPSPNVLREFDTVYTAWADGTEASGVGRKVRDDGNNQISQTIVAKRNTSDDPRGPIGGDVNWDGVYTLRSNAQSPLSTTDVNGEATVAFPTRYGGAPFFSADPVVVASVQSSSGVLGAMTVTSVTRTGVTVRLAGVEAGIQFKLSYIATGK